MIGKVFATIAWVPTAAIVIVIAVAGGLLIALAAVLIPFVKWLAVKADR
jgi:hypothetical protein